MGLSWLSYGPIDGAHYQLGYIGNFIVIVLFSFEKKSFAPKLQKMKL